ncbi:MAG: RNA polymerase sigma factor [Candidatus Adlerbacteria bacterium]|nr:RNA polymerase sigma factor [Candidatus Adlerbacteria bacterium]MDZ4226367.1 RNA polymerase sigma factor [Patescibacteria group bacterium]
MADLRNRFAHAYERYSDELFRHCSLRLSDRERALELTQECFLKTWEYIERGEQVEEFRPFLYRTLRNLIIDEYRRKKSHSLEAMLEGSEETDIEKLMPADESNTLEAAIERFEGKKALETLQKLPDLYREVLALRYVEGLSPKEIGDIVGESENAVSVRIHRGLKKLRALLEDTTLS